MGNWSRDISDPESSPVHCWWLHFMFTPAGCISCASRSTKVNPSSGEEERTASVEAPTELVLTAKADPADAPGNWVSISRLTSQVLI